ncbi:MAG: AraC family transcriptional regulator [Pseudomonadota bacterium]
MTKAESSPFVDDTGLVEFLRAETASALDSTSTNLGWSGLQASIWEQGDDAFTSPPLDSHFISLCLSGYALADIRMGSLTGSRFSIVEPGSICFMPACDTADFLAVGRFEAAHVLLSPHVIDAVIAERHEGDPAQVAWQGFHGQRHQDISQSIEGIVAEMRNARDHLVADRLAIRLAHHIVDHACDFSAMRCNTDEPVVDLTTLQFVKAVDYIEARLDQDFGLDEMAAYVGVDPLRLSAGFEAEAGVSIDHFRTERRLDTVRDWLAGPAAKSPAREIAAMIGFPSVAALDAAFRSHIGISFANYRHGRLA